MVRGIDLKFENFRDDIFEHFVIATMNNSDTSAIKNAEITLDSPNDWSDDEDERAGNDISDEVRNVFISDVIEDDTDYDEKSKSDDEDSKKEFPRHTIETLRELAISRGGSCLSSTFVDMGVHLEWQCCDGHIWNATPRNVFHNKSWCPKCRGNVGEEMVRAALIECFPGKLFERIRSLPWLGRLELDGYNPDLRLAFEYQGIQHFKYVPHFHREAGQYESQLQRDAQKRGCCADAGVTLLEIPYTVKLIDIRTAVRKMLTDLGLNIADMRMTNDEFYNTCRAGSHNNARLELAKKIAIEKGGVCLATKYIRNDVEMPFKCGFGHDFTASLRDINQDRSRGPRFCQECGGTKKQDEEKIRGRVEAIGYRLIAVGSRDSKNKKRRLLTVQCPANHDQYDVIMDNLLKKDGSLNKGCKKCGYIKTGRSKLSDLNEWSNETGIKLVGKYTGRNDETLWKCSMGHTFKARYDSLQSKKLACSACWLINYAASRGFEILTDVSDNIKKGDPITWKCLGCKQFTKIVSRVSVSKKDLICKMCK